MLPHRSVLTKSESSANRLLLVVSVHARLLEEAQAPCDDARQAREREEDDDTDADAHMAHQVAADRERGGPGVDGQDRLPLTEPEVEQPVMDVPVVGLVDGAPAAPASDDRARDRRLPDGPC